ncbi:hypothetical protein RF240_14375 [Dickeya dadantii]|uniref:hypothetical protein n=1 Tax=Dickeya dadantii TaxID=204038 RepID=UPI001CC49A55|nr:hypothetical protein [Dickeya dadantii]UAY97817.1 hypothetical protein KTF62_08105 [Dickeya dadantii]
MTLSGHVCVVYIDSIEVGRNEEFTLAPYQLGAAASAYLGRSQYARDSPGYVPPYLAAGENAGRCPA